MSFIGNSFTSQQFTPAVDYFNGNSSTTAFTLSKTVGSVYDIQVVIENVPQNPASAFTVSGNVITFTSAPPTGTNNIYVRYTSPMTNVVKPAPGTVSPTEINSSYSLWNLSGADINYTAGKVGIGTTTSLSQLTSLGTTSIVANSVSTRNPVASFRGGNDNNRLDVLVDNSGASCITGLSAWNVAGASSVMAFYTGTTGTEAMRIDSSGNVGIGRTPDQRLQIAQSSAVEFDMFVGTTRTLSLYADATQTILAAPTAIPMIFKTTDTERMRIDSGGKFYLNTTSGTNAVSALRNAGAASGKFWQSGPDSNNNYIVYNQAGTGVYVTDGGTSWTSNSDERLKTQLTPFENAIDKVCTLRTGTGRYLTDDESVSRSFLIAQDVQKILPEAVNVQEDELGTLGLQYTDIIPLLTAAIQEQQAIIEDLKSRIEVLEAK